MSLNTLSGSAATTLQNASFHLHGRRHGAHFDSGAATTGGAGTSSIGSAEVGGVGQLPVGATSALFSNLLQSLQQSVDSSASTASTATAAGSAAVGAVTTTAAPAVAGGSSAGGATAASSTATASSVNVAQDLRAFQHALFQALKQDGLQSGASYSGSASVASGAGGAATATASSGSAGNLTASLQNLIQQIGAQGKPTAATSTLAASYQQLVNGLASTGAVASANSTNSGTAASSASLQNFLNNLLQGLQTSGGHSLSGIGTNVNTNV